MQRASSELNIPVEALSCALQRPVLLNSFALDPTQFLFDFSKLFSCQKRKKERERDRDRERDTHTHTHTRSQVLVTHLNNPASLSLCEQVELCVFLLQHEKKKGKCGCIRRKKALVVAQNNPRKSAFKQSKRDCSLVSVSGPHNIIEVLVRVSPVGVTEVPVKAEQPPIM